MADTTTQHDTKYTRRGPQDGPALQGDRAERCSKGLYYHETVSRCGCAVFFSLLSAVAFY